MADRSRGTSEAALFSRPGHHALGRRVSIADCLSTAEINSDGISTANENTYPLLRPGHIPAGSQCRKRTGATRLGHHSQHFPESPLRASYVIVCSQYGLADVALHDRKY